MSPVTHENMNYTSAALGVIGVVSLLTWITTGRKRFTGPTISADIHNGESIHRASAEKTEESAEVVKVDK